MTEIQIADQTIPVDSEGFLANADDWTPDVAQTFAAEAGIQLTDRHWQVLTFCREDFAASGKSPGVRRITKVGGIPTKEMYSLFPGGPGKLAARLAGLPKPTGCV